MDKNTIYNFFGIKKDASKEEIKKAYRRKSKETHPDIGGNQEEFEKTTKYYHILNNSRTRQLYDKTGSTKEPPKNDQVEHLNILFKIFDLVLMRMQSHKTEDIFAKMRIEINQIIERTEGQKRTVTISNTNIEEILKRIKTKKKNLFKTILEEKREMNREALVIFAKNIEYHNEALKVLEDYEYQVDDLDSLDVSYFFQTGTSSTSAG